MTPRAHYVREQVEKAELELERRKAELEQLEASCPHEWGTTDPPEGGIVLPGTTFSRQCLDCGKIETTRKTKSSTIVEHKPDFGEARS